MENGTYAIVEWQDSRVSVINSTWFTPFKKEAFWPPCKDQKLFQQILKQNDPNIDDSWKLHPVKRCMFETEDFEKALKKCKEAEDTSNLESEDESGKRKRKVNQKYVSSSEDDEPVQKCKTKSKDLPGRPPRFVMKKSHLSQSETSSSLTQDLSHNLNNNYPKPNIKPIQSTSSVPSQNLSFSSDHSNKSSSQQDFNQKVLTLLYQVREQNDNILKIINKPSVEVNAPALKLPVEIPMKNLDQLFELETFLKLNEGNLSQFVTYLSMLGGKDYTSRTNRMLRHLLTDELATRFNFKGKKGKQPFGELTLNVAVIEAVKKSVTSTNSDVEGVIKVWLKHAPASCETVRSAVTAQFIRDLKGTIVSIFNEDSTLGKKYVFDIRRTCREVYDNARRAIYQESQARLALEGDKPGGSGCDGEHCKDSEKLTRFIEAMTCKICMDNRLDSVFLPCAHVVACSACAARIDRCPLCRSEITQAQKLYMPSW